jgi:hypothetical protein
MSDPQKNWNANPPVVHATNPPAVHVAQTETAEPQPIAINPLIVYREANLAALEFILETIAEDSGPGKTASQAQNHLASVKLAHATLPEIKAAAEKKAHDDKKAADKKAHDDKAAADKKAHDDKEKDALNKAAADRHAREDTARTDAAVKADAKDASEALKRQ